MQSKIIRILLIFSIFAVLTFTSLSVLSPNLNNQPADDANRLPIAAVKEESRVSQEGGIGSVKLLGHDE